MADFELRVNSRAFANRGVELDFDEGRYSTLLDELSQNPSPDETPIVSIEAAPIWGVSKTRRSIAEFRRDEGMYPDENYISGTKMLNLKIGENNEGANRLLLRATRQWAGDLNGELAEFHRSNHERRFKRRGITAGPVATGAVAGFELGEGAGALIGGVVGLIVGSVAGVADAERRPYRQVIKQFVEDPEVLDEYGHIINYKAL